MPLLPSHHPTSPRRQRPRTAGSSSNPARTIAPGPVVVLVAAVVAAAVLVGGCGGGGSSPEATAPVVATTSILADVTTQSTCGAVRVPSLVPRGADTHEYEPDLRDADRLRQASLVVANGLGLEEGLTDTIAQARQEGTPVLEVAPSADPLPADGSGDGELDPHVWMDPVRTATAVERIGQRLQQVDGLGVDDARIRSCTRRYAQRLRELAGELDATLAVVPPERRKLVTNHEALGYFADRFDLEVIGAVLPSTSSLGEPNPRDLDRLARAVRDAGVPAVFGETTQPAEVARSLADRVGGGVAVVELWTETLGPPGGPAGTYVGMLREDARRVAGALAPDRG